jgi:hypothetical protein
MLCMTKVTLFHNLSLEAEHLRYGNEDRGNYYLGSPIPAPLLPPLNEHLENTNASLLEIHDQNWIYPNANPFSANARLSSSGNRNQWTANEDKQLINLAKEMSSNGSLNVRSLARLFSEKNPHRTFFAVRRHAIRLIEKGVIVLPEKPPDSAGVANEPPSEIGNERSFRHSKSRPENTLSKYKSSRKSTLDVYWTVEEKQQLKELVEEMIRNGIFSAQGASQLFSEKNPHRTVKAAIAMIRRMVGNGVIVIPERKEVESTDLRRWSRYENQLLSRMMNENPHLSPIQIAQLFVEQTIGIERSLYAAYTQVCKLRKMNPQQTS